MFACDSSGGGPEEGPAPINLFLADLDEWFTVRKSVLTENSFYFDALVRYEESQRSALRDRSALSVRLDGISGWAVKMLLKALRNSPTQLFMDDLGPEDLYLLIAVSDYLQMDEHVMALLHELSLMLDTHNVLRTLSFALLRGLDKLSRACVDYLTLRFEPVYRCQLKSFFLIPIGVLQDICASDQLTCDETVICEAVLDWVTMNAECAVNERGQAELVPAQKDLVRTIRYAWLPLEFLLAQQAKRRRLCERFPTIDHFLNQAARYHSLGLNQQARWQQKDPYFSRPRYGRLTIHRFPTLEDSMLTCASRMAAACEEARLWPVMVPRSGCASPASLATPPDSPGPVSLLQRRDVVREYPSLSPAPSGGPHSAICPFGQWINRVVPQFVFQDTPTVMSVDDALESRRE